MSDKVFLGRDAILAIEDIPQVEIEIPEWHCWVRVRGLTGAQRDAYESENIKRRGKDVDLNLANARARLIARCLVDEKGQRLFTPQDVGLLGKKAAASLQRIFELAQRLSGLTSEDIEEMTKNSESDPNGAFTSD